MKSKFCRNNLFLVGIIVFLILFISACSSSNDAATDITPSDITITSLTEVAQINNGDAAVVICRDNYIYTVGWNGTNNSFNIIDMSDPTTPVTKGTYNVGIGWGLALNGNYAYIQTDGSGDGIFSNGTIGIMNITDPTNPVPVMQNDTGYSSAYQTYYHNGYVYNASYNIISIYSVADPASLVHVTNISATNSYWLAFSGNYMYSGNNGYLTIWNISNPITPVVTSSVSNADLGNDSGIAVEGNYVFVGSNKKVIVYDVSDKTNPTLVTTLALAGGTSTELTETRILSLPVYDYLLVAGENDFYVVNISDPTAPVEITSFPLSNNDGWGFDVLNDRYAIVADDTIYHVLKLW